MTKPCSSCLEASISSNIGQKQRFPGTSLSWPITSNLPKPRNRRRLIGLLLQTGSFHAVSGDNCNSLNFKNILLIVRPKCLTLLVLKRRVPRGSQMVPVISHFRFGAENRFEGIRKVHRWPVPRLMQYICKSGGQGKLLCHRSSQINSWMSYLQYFSLEQYTIDWLSSVSNSAVSFIFHGKILRLPTPSQLLAKPLRLC